MRRTTTFASFITSATLALALAGCAQPQVAGSDSGPGRDISVGDLVETIGRVMGRDVEAVLDEQRIRPAGSEVRRLLADPGKLQALTGWSAEVSLEEGLERTAAWFGDPANLAHYKTDRYNV